MGQILGFRNGDSKQDKSGEQAVGCPEGVRMRASFKKSGLKFGHCEAGLK